MDMEELVVPIVGAGLLGFLIVTGGGESAKSMLSSGEGIKEIRDNAALERIMSETKQEIVGDRSALAISRFEQGCTPHIKKSDYQRPEDTAIGAITVDYLPIHDGSAPINWQTGIPYSAGAVVCDWTGGTGIIGPDGVVTDYAFTGQDISALFQTNMEKFR